MRNLRKENDELKSSKSKVTIIFQKVVITIAIVIIAFNLLAFVVVAIAHAVVFSRADYDSYDSNRLLVYDDIKEDYPRESFTFQSGKNQLSGYVYGADNKKGVVIVSPGHRDSNDIKLYEVRYFVDSGFLVIGYDYTGCYTSEGSSMVGYSQSVYDLDALLNYVEKEDRFQDMDIFLFGHSMGAYSSGAVLSFGHKIKGAVLTSGLDSPREQWQYSIKRFTGKIYPLIKPMNALFIDLKYGKDQDLSVVKGINSVETPVWVISAENDIFYGGHSPIYDKQDQITNPNCSFKLMKKENHKEHYSYFLTDEALAYRATKPNDPVDKELYMQHDDAMMYEIIRYFERIQIYEKGMIE